MLFRSIDSTFNVIHAFFPSGKIFVLIFLLNDVAPLILYVGYLGAKEEKIPYYLFSFMQAIGVGAIGHHLISLIKIII